MIRRSAIALSAAVVLAAASCANLPPESPATPVNPVPYSRAFAPKPDYPESARKQGIEGTVIAWLYVEADTTVSRVVIRRSPHELLSHEAIATFSKWRVNPPIKDGKPTPFVAEYELEFRLNTPIPPPGGAP